MKKSTLIIFVFLSFYFIESSYSQDLSGNWCREEGGKIIDMIKIKSNNNGYLVSFYENENSSPYSEGFGVNNGNDLYFSAYNSGTKINVFIHCSIDGSKMQYKSFNLNGTLRWEGTFYKCK